MKKKPLSALDEQKEALLAVNSHYLVTGLQAQALRQSISVALIMNAIDPTPETIAYIAKRMVAREEVSLFDEIIFLKGRARRAAGK